MYRSRLRFLLLDKLERDLDIRLENKQLEYLFNDDEVALFLTPRRYGKDMATAMRIAIKMIEKPGIRIGVGVATTCQANLFLERLDETLSVLLRDFPVVSKTHHTKNPHRIELSNRSMVYVIPVNNFEYGMRGQRFDEGYIMDPSCMKNAREVYEIMSCTRLCSEDGKTIIVDTPRPNFELLDDLMRANYVTKIHVTRDHSPRLKAMDVSSIRNELDDVTYRSQILGEYRYN